MLAALGKRPHSVIVDPGRSIVGNAGVLLTRVEYVKPGNAKSFLVVDAAMNDLIRPALYGAWHEVRTVRESAAGAAVYDVVGPVCESADFLAKERRLAAARGRPAGDHVRGRLCHGDELELQHPAARRRGAGPEWTAPSWCAAANRSRSCLPWSAFRADNRRFP